MDKHQHHIPLSPYAVVESVLNCVAPLREVVVAQGVVSEEEAFVCPFCGAPYHTLIPAGAVQVTCGYCKATILVPPRLGGTVRRCPNHPGVVAVGFCSDCEDSYCDRCLYTVKDKRSQVTLYFCPTCNQKRIKGEKARFGIVFGLLAGLFFFYGLVALGVPGYENISYSLFGVGIFWVLVGCWLILNVDRIYKPRTVHETPTKRSRMA